MIPQQQLYAFFSELEKQASAIAATADLLGKHWKPLTVAGGSIYGYKKLEGEAKKYQLGRQMYAQQGE